ncbi:MAG TPA: AAA family ATPase [Candidatus Saccharimonadales bacterium]|nr:AAA family ATPase [Candidatus Saccharimonadales bacterium]
MKFRNIVVAGDVGTGTSTLAHSLADKFGWKYIAAGDFFRNYAKEHNIPLWNKEAIPDDFDKEVDDQLTNKLKEESGWVVDSHYAGWFLREDPQVFRILLTCDRKVATQRMQQRDHTHEETSEEIEKRRAGLYAKFKKLYSDDNYEDPKFYDLVIDTTNTTAEETLNQAFDQLKNKEGLP